MYAFREMSSFDMKNMSLWHDSATSLCITRKFKEACKDDGVKVSLVAVLKHLCVTARSVDLKKKNHGNGEAPSVFYCAVSARSRSLWQPELRRAGER